MLPKKTPRREIGILHVTIFNTMKVAKEGRIQLPLLPSASSSPDISSFLKVFSV